MGARSFRRAGIDEAGRGPWAGPVVAACVILPQKYDLPGLADSKKLSRRQREILYAKLLVQAEIGSGFATVHEIVAHNILQASLLAMRRAVADLAKPPDFAQIDGLHAPDLPCRAETVVKGDDKIAQIAAASIIAKVIRDRIMCVFSCQYPGYGFEKNSGYGTKYHHDALQRLGVCPIHRSNFAPIRKHIGVCEKNLLKKQPSY